MSAYYLIVLGEPRISPYLEKAAKAAGQVEFLTQRIETQFDLSIPHDNATQLHAILNEIINEKENITAIQVQIQTAIDSDHLQNFFERAMIGWLNADFRNCRELLNSIAFEILGHQAKILTFSRGHISSVLLTTEQLVEAKSSSFISELFEADKLVKAAFEKVLNGTRVENSEVNHITQQLQKVVQVAEKSKDEMARGYYAEVEKSRYENRRLDRVQTLKLQRFIDAMYFIVHFVNEYQSTFVQAINAF